MKNGALKAFSLAIFCSATGHAATSEDPLQGLDFLLGEWRAEPPSQGGDVFRRDLDGQIIVRTAHADAGNDAKGVNMKMAMTFYSERGHGVLAIYFDNDGHVIHYKVGKLVAGSSIELVSDPSTPGPRFRLTYSTRGKDQLSAKFEMAPPGDHVQYVVIAEGIEKRDTP